MTHFVADAVRPMAGDRPVRVVPPAVALRALPSRRLRDPASRFTILAMFDAASSLSRKNPEGMIEAFRPTFGRDCTVRLLLKTQRFDEFPVQAARLAAPGAAANIEIRDISLASAGLEALYEEADVFLPLHRAEGFGLPMAEAMWHGLPVIGTGWSGSADFLNDQVGIPVPWRLVSAEDPQRTYHHPDQQWAEPDLEAAAEAYRARLASLGMPV